MAIPAFKTTVTDNRWEMRRTFEIELVHVHHVYGIKYQIACGEKSVDIILKVAFDIAWSGVKNGLKKNIESKYCKYC